MKKMVLLVLALGLVASVALGEDRVDNPEYKSWSPFKVGTTVKRQTTGVTTVGDKETTSTMTMTSTLKELTADKAVIEVVIGTDVNGKTMTNSGRHEIPAKVAKVAASQPASQPATQPGEVKVTKKAEGDEEVPVGDKKYKCHWVESQMTGEKQEGTLKVWTCADFPGGTVKSLKTASDTTKSMKVKVTMEVVEFKAGS